MAFQVEQVERYFDIRQPGEYITDEKPKLDITEVKQKYKFAVEFMSQILQCAHCGTIYKPSDNYSHFGCRMHPGTIAFDTETNNPIYACCGSKAGAGTLDIGCIPCIHSSKLSDFENIVVLQRGYKKIPIEMVDLLKAFPVNRDMIVGVSEDEELYMFAVTLQQLELVRSTATSANEDDYYADKLHARIVSGDSSESNRDPFADELPGDRNEDELYQQFEDRLEDDNIVASDNWKIKLLTEF